MQGASNNSNEVLNLQMKCYSVYIQIKSELLILYHITITQRKVVEQHILAVLTEIEFFLDLNFEILR